MVLFFFLRMPIGFTMLFVGTFGFCLLVSPTAGLSLLGHDIFGEFSHYSYTVFPAFIFAGTLAFATGIGQRLFQGFYTVFRRVPGSLVVASIFGCAGFSAICGSSTATAATMGKVALPEMRKYGYNDSLATGAIAVAGGLGPLIPPSNAFILYGILTDESIGKLFIAGILPGIMVAGMLAGAAGLLCLRHRDYAPIGPPPTRKQTIDGITGFLETGILFGATIGGIFFGWFTPTQGGAALATAVFVLGLIRRQLTWRGLVEAVRDSLRITCMIMIILVGGIVFSRFLAVTNIPFALADVLTTGNIPPMFVLVIILAMYVITGFFMDSMGVLILTLPIIYPTILALGFDPLWFGVLVVITGETAVVTPPVAVNVYVVHSVAGDIPLGTIVRGIWPFLWVLIAALIIIVAFPQIATFLPAFMTY